ncbi:MAG: zf-HC2 domain-containing protein [Rhodocyclaceae bacterium]|nr:zf-HC2 domain-containing protein [Rhodocyclaceae bacterium]
MLSCKEVTRLLSEGQDRKLALAEKMQLEMHLAMCKGCKNFKGQMSFLRTACQRYVKNHGGQNDEQ